MLLEDLCFQTKQTNNKQKNLCNFYDVDIDMNKTSFVK